MEGGGNLHSQTWQPFSFRLLVPSEKNVPSFCWVINLDISLPEQSEGRAQSAPPNLPPSGSFLEILVLKTLDELSKALPILARALDAVQAEEGSWRGVAQGGSSAQAPMSACLLSDRKPTVRNSNIGTCKDSRRFLLNLFFLPSDGLWSSGWC